MFLVNDITLSEVLGQSRTGSRLFTEIIDGTKLSNLVVVVSLREEEEDETRNRGGEENYICDLYIYISPTLTHLEIHKVLKR